MSERTGQMLPHPGLAGVDWAAVEREATQALSEYVRLDSSHPAGRTTETAAFMAARLAAEGIDSRIYETETSGRVNLVARLKSARPVGKPLVLSNHMDVVQAVASDWTFDPYSGEVANGYVYGRGALDMKGMGIMELMTMLLLKRRGVELERDVVLLCTCDEEVGSVLGAKLMVERHLADLDPEFVLDEGGWGWRVPPPIGDIFGIVLTEKRAVRFRMVARAEPGHGSQPWKGAATHRLVRAANAILSQDPENRLSPVVSEMVKRLGGESIVPAIASHRATRVLLHDTVSLTMLQGGYKINVIPEQAEMSFDCRLLPDTDERAFVSNLEQLVNDPSVTFHVDWPNAKEATSPIDNPLYQAIEAACQAHAPHARVVPSICPGGTDARFFRQAGVPAYGLVPCIFTAEDLKTFHGIDERLSVENLLLGCKIMYDLTQRVAAARA